MRQQAQGSYTDYRVLTAGPAARVRMLYDKTIAHVDAAHDCLRQNDPEGRGRSVTSAHAILGELMVSLNHDLAPELSHRLETFYEYLQWRLLTGHSKRDAAAFEEVKTLLASLSDAWAENKVPAEEPEEQPPAATLPPSAAPATHPYLRQTAERTRGRVYL